MAIEGANLSGIEHAWPMQPEGLLGSLKSTVSAAQGSSGPMVIINPGGHKVT